jgi:hypothetical protein
MGRWLRIGGGGEPMDYMHVNVLRRNTGGP